MASNQKTLELLSRYPGPVTLYPSRRKWLLVLLGGLAFTAGGLWLLHQGDPMGWAVAIFFAAVAIVAAVAMTPGAGYLSLDQNGFESRNLFRNQRVRWQDTKGFEANTPLRVTQQLVVYDDITHTGAITKVNTSLTGRNAALGDTYGLSAVDLAQLMAQWRERALAAAGRPAP